ncbi:protein DETOXIFICATION 16-like isoform X1 [Nymphaea colorata]|nr:protein DETOXIFICATION 16-like isoform X1 [Nymphaea colorata]
MAEEKEVYSPLLSPSSPSLHHEEEREVQQGCRTRGEATLQEAKRLLWLAGPLIAANLLQRCIQMTSVMFVGHLGQLALSGASMATSFITVTGFSVVLGLATALDTLCGQAYGAKQYHMLGVYMQRSVFILSIVSIPLAFLWAYTEKILLAFGQDDDISREAGTYARWMIPTLFSYGILQSEVRFLQTQNIVLPMMLSTGLCALLHFLVCWALVFKSGLGYRGAALANSISYWINVLLLALYIKFSSACNKSWTGFSRRAVRDVTNFIKLAAPSAVMACFEWWSFEVLTLLAGLLPNPKVETSVLAIILNTSSTAFMVPLGLASAVSTRVANELGAGRPQAARMAVRIVLLLVIVQATLVSMTIIFIRGVWGYAFSNDKEVAAYVADIMPLLALTAFVDAIGCVLSGVARGCGWQKYGAVINLGAYYIVGVPLAVVLAFVLHSGGKGLWFGVTCAIFVQMGSFLALTIFTNWEEEAKKARDQVYISTLRTDGAM